MDCCCHGGAPDAPPAPSLSPSNGKPTSWLRRVARVVQWAIPLITLALLPKCPACVAAYVFLFTGIGLSFQAAAAMRWTLIVLSVVSFAYLVLRTLRQAIARRFV